MVSNSIPAGTIKSDDTLISIINSLHDQGKAGVTELADQLEISKSTVHKHLKSLEKHELVYKDSRCKYRLGLRFLTYGGALRDNNELCKLVGPKMNEIIAETTSTCGFAVEEHGYGIYTHLQWGKRSVPRTQPMGERFYLHMNASGKAILAKMDDEEIESIIENRGMPAQTPNTITDRDNLFNEIQRIRNQGYAMNIEERFEGIRSIAAGIKHPQTDQVGAIGMAAPATRLQKEELEEQYADILRSTINEIELQLKFDG